ncbi:MAG: DUF488 domain-containing protein [Candidatus Aureabacteria bacterium]|nr:DUF488 domain-containing protein [Candidatus Auribacterota bacterium]
MLIHHLGLCVCAAALSMKPPASSDRPTLYTIGTGNRSTEELLRALRVHGIESVVDVRTTPYSRRNSHFNREQLQERLAKAGIEYVHMGDSLGGLPEGGFERHRMSGPYRRGIGTLIKGARSRRSAIMCAESDPTQCHRLAIGKDVEAQGWRIVHILDKVP